MAGDCPGHLRSRRTAPSSHPLLTSLAVLVALPALLAPSSVFAGRNPASLRGRSLLPHSDSSQQTWSSEQGHIPDEMTSARPTGAREDRHQNGRVGKAGRLQGGRGAGSKAGKVGHTGTDGHGDIAGAHPGLEMETSAQGRRTSRSLAAQASIPCGPEGSCPPLTECKTVVLTANVTGYACQCTAGAKQLVSPWSSFQAC